MTMHEDYTMLMSLVLDDEATQDEQTRLRAHLGACGACTVTWENWKAADRLLASAPMIQAPADLLAGLAVRLEAYEARRRQARWLGVTGIVFLWAVILSGVMAVLAGLALGWLREPELLGAIAASVRQLSSGVAWTLRGAGTLVRSIGWQPFALMLGLYLSAAGIMIMTWLWVLGRSRAWAPRVARVR